MSGLRSLARRWVKPGQLAWPPTTSTLLSSRACTAEVECARMHTRVQPHGQDGVRARAALETKAASCAAACVMQAVQRSRLQLWPLAQGCLGDQLWQASLLEADVGGVESQLRHQEALVVQQQRLQRVAAPRSAQPPA